jgi:hypothetical protein
MNWREVANPAFLVALAVMSLSAIGMKTAIEHYKIHLQKKPVYAEEGRLLRAIPTETLHWQRLGQDHIEASEIAAELGTDNYVTRFYVPRAAGASNRKMVQLHAAYYTGMIDTVPHVPERCLTGGGMALVGGPWTVPVPLNTSDWRPATDVDARHEGRVYTARLSNEYSTAGGGRRVNLPFDLTPTKPLTLRVSKFMTASGQEHYAGYFFIANGGWVSSAEGVRQLSFDLTNDYAYYLKVQVGSTEVDSPEDLAEVSASLLDDLLGELMTCVPDWAKVQRGDWPPDNPRRQTSPQPGP